MFQRAVEIPSFENKFRRLYLNQWTSKRLDGSLLKNGMPAERMSLQKPSEPDCYAGLDLSTKIDLSGLSLVFQHPEEPLMCFRSFGSRKILSGEGSPRRVPYDVWKDKAMSRPPRGTSSTTRPFGRRLTNSEKFTESKRLVLTRGIAAKSPSS